MPSPRPIKEFREKIKVNPKSVKVVKPTNDLVRKSLNAMETTRTTVTKSGALAKREAARVEMRNSGTKPKVVTINSNMGGLTGTKKIGGGGGFFGLPKNR